MLSRGRDASRQQSPICVAIAAQIGVCYPDAAGTGPYTLTRADAGGVKSLTRRFQKAGESKVLGATAIAAAMNTTAEEPPHTTAET